MSSTLRTFAAELFDAARDTLHRFTRHDIGLADLDDRTLADIGVSRSEIASIEAEAQGRNRPTRRRIVAEPRHA